MKVLVDATNRPLRAGDLVRGIGSRRFAVVVDLDSAEREVVVVYLDDGHFNRSSKPMSKFNLVTGSITISNS